MSQPTPGKSSKPRRWLTWRRALNLLIALVLLVFTGYMVENWRGRRVIATQVARYGALGLSLNEEDYFPQRVAPEDNFCATPLLDGIAISDSDDTVPGWEAAREKRRRLQFGLSHRHVGEDFMAHPRQLSWGKVQEDLAEDTVPNGSPATRPKGAPRTLPRWNVDENQPASAESVHTALDAERALFEELTVAARRPKAVFTPQPCDYYPPWQIRGEAFFGANSLSELLRLRIASAAETGRFTEAADLTLVLWRLRDALAAEPGWALISFGSARHWMGAIKELLASQPPAEVLRQLIAPALKWDAEGEYRKFALCSAAISARVWQTLADEAAWTFAGDLHGFFRPQGFVKISSTRTMQLIPSGWLRQNGANRLRCNLDYSLTPFLSGGFPALAAAEEAFKAEEESRTYFDHLVVRFPAGSGEGKYACQSVQCARLTILALGMELHRAANGRYPATVAMLAPESLPVIPRDLDGLPLRAVVSEDGQRAVIYSVGWNQRDDWHGVPPDKPVSVHQAADWFLQLPLRRVAAKPARPVSR